MNGWPWFWGLIELGAGIGASLFLAALGLEAFLGVLAEGLGAIRESWTPVTGVPKGDKRG